MKYIEIALGFLGKVVVLTFFQLAALLGFFFLFGIILYFISRSTRKAFVNSYNNKLDTVLTGWIGTPVHEIGHAIFCVLFGHRINEIKLFSPNNTDGTLGYVNHSFNPNSIYQKAGNFFIGAGPIIFGSFVIFCLIFYLVPNYNTLSPLMSNFNLSGQGILDLAKSAGGILKFGFTLIGHIFTGANFKSLLFWVFIYLSICISSHMKLSPPDLKGMWSGFVTIVLFFLIVNFFALLFGNNLTGYVFMITKSFGFAIGIFILAIFISFINFLITYLILSIIHYTKYKRILSIF